jgi:hypothetical protein
MRMVFFSVGNTCATESGLVEVPLIVASAAS